MSLQIHEVRPADAPMELLLLADPSETPANIAHECRLAGLKRKLAHAGMHAVGAHYQVVLATRPVGERAAGNYEWTCPVQTMRQA